MTESDYRLYQGSRASKFLGGVSFVLLLFGIAVLLGGHWFLTVACVVASTAAAFVSYRLSGGRQNPQIYADLDLFRLIGYAVQSGNARIGFHSLRTQDGIASALQSVGFPLSTKDIRQEIRRLIVKDRRAFDACRDLMVIQTVHGGREHFWNGFGELKPVQWFNEAEIIIDIQSSATAVINRLFELVNQES